MIKKSFLCVVGIFLVGMMSYFLMDTAQAKDEVITLTFANYFPTTAPQSIIFESFVKDLETQTNGRITIKYLTGGSLLSGPGMFKGIETGIADMGYSHVFYTPGRMPVTEFTALPFGYQSAWVSSRVLNDFYKKFKPKEWDSVKVLFINGCAPNPLLTTTPVEKLEDLKGLTIRAPGQIAEIVSALGATPSPTPMGETYEAISKGVSQGAYLTFEGLKTWRLADVCKYVTNCWQVGNTFPFYLIMNKNRYDKIPADLKKVFDKLVGEYAERVAMVWNNIDIEGKNYGAEKGVHFIELPDQEAVRWKEAVETKVVDVWMKRMVEKGFPESEVKGWVSFLKEHIELEGKEQIGLKITSVTGPSEMRPENIRK